MPAATTKSAAISASPAVIAVRRSSRSSMNPVNGCSAISATSTSISALTAGPCRCWSQPGPIPNSLCDGHIDRPD